jgi:hypothetical protein
LLFGALVVASVLLNPHVYGYDLVVLAPALMVAIDRAVSLSSTRRASKLGLLAAALMLVPLLAPVAAFTRIQLSVPLLAWFGWELVREAERDAETAREEATGRG